jgi:hypothetical protein
MIPALIIGFSGYETNVDHDTSCSHADMKEMGKWFYWKVLRDI